jgi:hypothetical protein
MKGGLFFKIGIFFHLIVARFVGFYHLVVPKAI